MILFIIQISAFSAMSLALLFLSLSVFDLIRVGVPFVPVRKRALPLIVKALQLSSGNVIYDLGCGDGRVLLACVKSVEKTSGVGVERGIMPFLISSVKTRGLNIKIAYGDIFKMNLAGATHIFCYLSGPAMGKLEKKFQEECRAGTRIVSCDFQLPHWTPKEIIPVAEGNNKLARKLFVYVKD